MKLTETIAYCIELVEDELFSLEYHIYDHLDDENPPSWVESYSRDVEVIREHLENLKTIRDTHYLT